MYCSDSVNLFYGMEDSSIQHIISHGSQVLFLKLKERAENARDGPGSITRVGRKAGR